MLRCVFFDIGKNIFIYRRNHSHPSGLWLWRRGEKYYNRMRWLRYKQSICRFPKFHIACKPKYWFSKYTARLLNYHKKYSPLPYRSGQFSSSDAIQASQALEYKVKMTTKWQRRFKQWPDINAVHVARSENQLKQGAIAFQSRSSNGNITLSLPIALKIHFFLCHLLVPRHKYLTKWKYIFSFFTPHTPQSQRI